MTFNKRKQSWFLCGINSLFFSQNVYTVGKLNISSGSLSYIIGDVFISKNESLLSTKNHQ